MPTKTFTEASAELEAAIRNMAAAWQALALECREVRRSNHRRSGNQGANWATPLSADRVAREVVGALVGAGLGPLFDDAGIHLGSIEPVDDLAERWEKRDRSGRHITPPVDPSLRNGL